MAKINTIIVGGSEKDNLKKILDEYIDNEKTKCEYADSLSNLNANSYTYNITTSKKNQLLKIYENINDKINKSDSEKVHSLLYCINGDSDDEQIEDDIENIMFLKISGIEITPVIMNCSSSKHISEVLLKNDFIKKERICTINFDKSKLEQFEATKKICNNMHDSKYISIKNYKDIQDAKEYAKKQFEQLKSQFPMDIIVVGNKGIGKSELINSLLGRPDAETGISGMGTITKKIQLYLKDNFKIYDTPGIITDDILENIIKHINSLENKSLHSLWYCINPNALINSDEDDDKTIDSKIDNELKKLTEIKDKSFCDTIIVLTKAIENDNYRIVKDVLLKKLQKNYINNSIPIIDVIARKIKNSDKKNIEQLEHETAKRLVTSPYGLSKIQDLMLEQKCKSSNSQKEMPNKSLETEHNEVDDKLIDTVDIILENSKPEHENNSDFNNQIKSIASKLFDRNNLKHRLDVAWQIATTDIAEKMKHYNIVLMGQSGVGKSTLINAILCIEKAETKSGLPCTQKLMSYEGNTSVPLRLWDTKGLELNNTEHQIFEVKKLIEASNKSQDPDKYIHAIWYCPNMSRIQQLEINTIKELTKMYEGKNGLPVILVLTKAIDKKEYKSYSQNLKELGITNEIIPVLSKDYGGTKAFGKDELIKKTLNIVPNSAINAALTASKSSINKQLENINEKAQQIIRENQSTHNCNQHKSEEKQKNMLQHIDSLYAFGLLKEIDDTAEFVPDNKYFDNINMSIISSSTQSMYNERLQDVRRMFNRCNTLQKLFCTFATAVSFGLVTPSDILAPKYKYENIQISRVGNAYINSMESLIRTSFDNIVNNENSMAIMREKLEIAKESMSKDLNISKKDNDAIDKLSLEEFNNEFTPRVKHHTIKQTRNTNDYTGFENSLDILD